MSIYRCAHLCNKQVVLTYLTAVKMQAVNLFVRAAENLYRLNRTQ